MAFSHYTRASATETPDSESAPLGLNAAARAWARLTGRERPHRATILRWCTRGVRGVRLRGERAGNEWLVTPAALREFHRQINTPSPQAAARVGGPVRVAEVARAMQELEELTRPRRQHHPVADLLEVAQSGDTPHTDGTSPPALWRR